MNPLHYPVDIIKEDGLFRVVFPDFDATETFGETRSKALEAAADLLETMVSVRIMEGADLPVPSPAYRRPVVHLPPVTAIKASLYQTMRADGVTRAELARRLGWKWPQVARLTDPRHPSRLEQLEAAMFALGRRITVAVEVA